MTVGIKAASISRNNEKQVYLYHLTSILYNEGCRLQLLFTCAHMSIECQPVLDMCPAIVTQQVQHPRSFHFPHFFLMIKVDRATFFF